MGLVAGLGAAGAGLSALGTLGSGFATSSAESYQAQVARNNAQVARQNAVYSTEAGEQQATATGLKSAAQAGQVRASQAANGIDVNSGSAVDVQASQREQGNIDVQQTAQNAELQAYGYRTQATSDEAQAGLDETAAKEAPIGAAIGATGGLLSNASSLSFKWGGASAGNTVAAGS